MMLSCYTSSKLNMLLGCIMISARSEEEGAKSQKAKRTSCVFSLCFEMSAFVYYHYSQF